MHPKLFKKGSLIIAGITGDGNKTGELWHKFMETERKIGLKNKL